ncbi:MAG: hypothetical protein IIA67_04340 [Planctomycetes bacterium]|nr:hypothetical protein [Planctomycetota bacterium]
MVTEEHFEKAIQDTPKAARNPAQSAHVSGSTEPEAQTETPVIAEQYEG